MDFAAFIARSNYGKSLAVISGMGISKEALSHIRLRRTQRQQTACSGNSYCDRNIFCGLGNTICSHQINMEGPSQSFGLFGLKSAGKIIVVSPMIVNISELKSMSE